MRVSRLGPLPAPGGLTAVSLAAGAALVALATGGAQAQTVLTGTLTSTQSWTSGDLSIDAGAHITVPSPGDGVNASGGSLGTLTNGGTITAAGGMGIVNSGTGSAVINSANATIDAYVGIGNIGNIGTVSNHGTIRSQVLGIDNFNNGVPPNIDLLENTGSISADGTGMGPPSGTGVHNSGHIGTLANSGTISGATLGIHNEGGNIDVLENTGGISTPGVAAIYNENGTIGTLRNRSGGTITGAAATVRNEGTIGALVNNGVLNGFSINLGAVTTVTNTGFIDTLSNTPSASGASGPPPTPGHGVIDTITNSGTIGALGNDGSLGTVDNSGTLGTVITTRTIGTLDNTGTITPQSAAFHGVFTVGRSVSPTTLGTIDALNNSGLISSANEAVYNEGKIGTLANSGTIRGAGTGIFNDGILGTLANTGTITGASYAIHNSALGSIGAFSNSGVIAGNIANDSTQDLAINGASSSSYGVLTGYGGAMGLITNAGSNVVFGSGKLLLDDHIDAGSHGVINSAATVRVDHAVSITGNYIQGAGATLLVGVADGAVATGSLPADSGYGRLAVSGTATVTPGSSIAFQKTGSYGFAAGQRYVVIDAANTGTDYNAGSLKYSVRGYDSVLSGAAVTSGARSALVVTVLSATESDAGAPPDSGTGSDPGSGSGPTGPAALQMARTPNAASSLRGLFNYTGIDPALLDLFNAGTALGLGTPAAATRAGTQLGPVPQVAGSRAAAAPALDVLTMIGTHLDSRDMAPAYGGGMATGAATPATRVWGDALGGHASQDEADHADGYRANYGGLLLGADRALNDRWLAGGAFSYTNTKIDTTGDSQGDWARVNAYGLTGYARYSTPTWYANFSAGAIFQRYDTSRTVRFDGYSGDAQGQFNGMQYVARAEAGYPLAMGAYTLTPVSSVTYSYLRQNSYTESGDATALSVDGLHATSVKSDLGAKLERDFMTSLGVVVPSLKLAWRHEYGHNRLLATSSFAADASGETAFTTTGARPVADMAVVSAGVTLLKASNLSLTARYELQAASGYRAQTGMLRLRQLF